MLLSRTLWLRGIPDVVSSVQLSPLLAGLHPDRLRLVP